jgi:Ca2+-transporting ATPase
MIVFIGGQAFSVTSLNGAQWGISVGLGLLSIPVGVIIRLIPDELIAKLIPILWTRKRGPRLLVSDEDRRYEWNPALEEIRDQLTFLKTVRGGRLKNLKYKLQLPESLIPRSRSGSRSRDNSIPQTPVGDQAHELTSPAAATPESRSRHGGRSRSNSAFGPAAAMAGIVAGSIAGWSPVERGLGEADSIRFSRSRAHSGLDQEEGIEIHPDTREDDPIIADYSTSSNIPPSQNPDLTPVFPNAPPPSNVSSHRRRSNSRLSVKSVQNPPST